MKEDAQAAVASEKELLQLLIHTRCASHRKLARVHKKGAATNERGRRPKARARTQGSRLPLHARQMETGETVPFIVSLKIKKPRAKHDERDGHAKNDKRQ